MVNRFVRIRSELEEVANTDGLDLTISRTPRFRTQHNKLALHLKGINTVEKALQKRGATLDECQFLLDTLTETVEDQKDNVAAPLYGCTLKNDYIKLHCSHSPSSVFGEGVVKIQRRETDTMTDDECSACAYLKKPTETNENESSTISDDGTLSMSDIFKKRKRRRREPVESDMNL